MDKVSTIKSQEELEQLFEDALKDVDSELLETLEFVSKLSTDDNSHVFQITTTQSGTITNNNYAEQR